MKLPASLRLVLVPIGVLIASKGLDFLSDEHDRLTAAVDERRAELAAAEPAAPEDLRNAAAPADPDPAKSPVRRPSRLLVFVASAAAFGLGAYATMRAQQWAQDRAIEQAADEHAAAVFRGEVDPWDAEQVNRTAPCGVCGARLSVLESYPGHLCAGCWTVVPPVDRVDLGDAPAMTEPGCTHPKCIRSHPHAGPALLSPLVDLDALREHVEQGQPANVTMTATYIPAGATMPVPTPPTAAAAKIPTEAVSSGNADQPR